MIRAKDLRYKAAPSYGFNLFVEQLQLLEHFWRAQRLGWLGHNKLLSFLTVNHPLERGGIFRNQFQHTLIGFLHRRKIQHWRITGSAGDGDFSNRLN
jgi:hypothetical protein